MEKKKSLKFSLVIGWILAVVAVALIGFTVFAFVKGETADFVPVAAGCAALAIAVLALAVIIGVRIVSTVASDNSAADVNVDTKNVEDKIDAVNKKLDELIEAVKGLKIEAVVAAPVAPAPLAEDEDRDSETVVDETTGQTYIVRYNKSHEAKMALAKPEVNDWYNEVKNYILSFGANSRVSWKYDAFNVGRDQIAKMSIKGKTLSIYVALDPKAYVEGKYHAKDVSSSKTYEATPTQMKIKSARGVKFAKELVDAVMAPLGLKSSGVDSGDFRFKPRKFNTLLKNELIKKSKALVK